MKIILLPLLAIATVVLMSCSNDESLTLEPGRHSELGRYSEPQELLQHERLDYLSEWVSNITLSDRNCADSLHFLNEVDVLILECDSIFERAHYSYTGDTLRIQILEPLWIQDGVGRMDTISEWTLIKDEEELTMASIMNKKGNKWIEVPAEGYYSYKRFKKIK